MNIAKIVPIFKSGNKKNTQQLETDNYSPCFFETIRKTRMQSACKLSRDTWPFIQTSVWLSSTPHHCSSNFTAPER